MPPETAPGLIGAHRDDVGAAGAGLDPQRTARDLEAAVGVVLGRNARLHGRHITAADVLVCRVPARVVFGL